MAEASLLDRLDALKSTLRRQTSPHDHISFFVADLADILVLPGAGDVVLFLLAPDIDLDNDVASQMEEIIQTRSYRDRLKFVEYSHASAGGLEVLKQIPNLAAYSRADLGQLKKTVALKTFLIGLMVKGVSLAALNPYVFQGPVTGSRFFGREDELRTLRLQTSKSFVISGARRSGKTSLMMELQRQLRPTPNELSIFVNFETCQSFADVPYLLLRRLAEDLKASAARLSEWSDNLLRLASSRQWKESQYLSRLVSALWDLISSEEDAHRIRFFFDEYNCVVDLERSLNYVFSKAWRDLVLRSNAFNRGQNESTFVQFIFAGSQTLYEELLSTSSPFYNIGAARLLLQNFSLDTLTALVTRPMRELGVKIEDAARVAQVLLEQTGGHPATTQHLMSLVVSSPELEKTRSIGFEDVLRAATRQEFLGFLRDTLAMNVSALGRFILAQMVVNHKPRVSVDFIQGIGRRHSIQFDESPLNVQLQNLASSGYLRSLDFAAGQLLYELAVPVVKHVFAADDVPKLINEMLAKKQCAPLPKG